MAGAVCPYPPLLVPAVASGAATELDDLRAACDTAVGRLVASHPDVVVVAGRATTAGWLPGHGGTLAPYGVPVQTGDGPPVLPLPHTIGCWLLDRAGWSGERRYVGATNDGIAEGAGLVASAADRVAVLTMGDASACRTEKAPGFLDPRAADHDRSVARAFADGPHAVAALDGALATAVLADGWAAWQLLARVVDARPVEADVLYDDAPYGVGYLVATWVPAA